VLGRAPDAYAAALTGAAHWGGALECRALSELLGVQVATADIRSAALHVFCEERAFARRLYLLYDGIHYDAIVGADARLFSPRDDAAAIAAVALADELRRAHAFTDTAHFTLACSSCGALVAGAAEAQAHAERTGHGDFVERRP
jgi:ubiquitin thioesterase OTU1